MLQQTVCSALHAAASGGRDPQWYLHEYCRGFCGCREVVCAVCAPDVNGRTKYVLVYYPGCPFGL